MAHVVIQPKRGKKITYDDIPNVNYKEHYNGHVETIELGEVILTSWDVVKTIPIQEHVEVDGSRKYYTPLILDWADQFTKKEFTQQVKQGNYHSYYFKAFNEIEKRIERGDFISSHQRLREV